MKNQTGFQTENLVKNRIRHDWLRRSIALLSAFVLLFTMNSLKMNAVTQERIPMCGLEEHVHTAACYPQTLVCTLEEADPVIQTRQVFDGYAPHKHTADCYDNDGKLACGYVEGEYYHVHNSYCYQNGHLVCGLDERRPHVHTDDCYEDVATLVCGLEESEGHVHGDDCFEEHEELTCGLAESDGHEHTEVCFEEHDELTCGLAESDGHEHSDACYTEHTDLTCDLAESDGHQHTDDCYIEKKELTCDRKESDGHQHTKDCYTRKLVCDKEEGEDHQHTDDCYEEVLTCGKEVGEGAHHHNDDCYTITRELACGKEAGEGAHHHTDDCYTTTRELTCGKEAGEGAHHHTAECYTKVRECVCGLEEGEGAHHHTEECYTTVRECVCGLEEGEGAHQHTDECYEHTRKLVCGKDMAQIVAHKLGVESVELHHHTDSCFYTVKRRVDGEERELKFAKCGCLEVPELENGPENWSEETVVLSPGHKHTAECYETATEPACGLVEHVHTDACFQETPVKPETVAVTFVCEPEDAVVTVYPVAEAAEGEEPTEVEAIEAGEDGAWALLPGEYTYNAEAEGYVPAEGVAFTVADEPLEIAVTLEAEPEPEPEPEPVAVTFVCEPADAVVTVYPVAEAVEGEEPTEVEAIEAGEDGAWALLPGEYTYNAEAEGYVPAEGVAFTVADEPLEIAVTLEAEPEPEPEPVAVTFVCEPADAVVTVYPVAEAVEGEEPTEVEAIEAGEDGAWALLPGEYTYNAEAEGYVPAEGVAFTVADEPLEIAVTLEAEPEPEPEMPAFSQSKKVSGVIVTVEAEEGVFPADATLSVKLAKRADRKAVESAVEGERDEDQNVASSYTFDIKVLDAEGNEIQPADGQRVSVSFALDKVADENLTTNVYHVTEDEEGALTAEKLDVVEDGETATAETEGFSFYTVEFTYDSRQYVLEGDGSVALSVIQEAIELPGEVTAVSVSDDTLFNAAWSDEANDWIVSALQPFTSTEWMKLTINGTTYKVDVTDDINEPPIGIDESNCFVLAANDTVKVSFVDENGADVTGEYDSNKKYYLYGVLLHNGTKYYRIDKLDGYKEPTITWSNYQNVQKQPFSDSIAAGDKASFYIVRHKDGVNNELVLNNLEDFAKVHVLGADEAMGNYSIASKVHAVNEGNNKTYTVTLHVPVYEVNVTYGTGLSYSDFEEYSVLALHKPGNSYNKGIKLSALPENGKISITDFTGSYSGSSTYSSADAVEVLLVKTSSYNDNGNIIADAIDKLMYNRAQAPNYWANGSSITVRDVDYTVKITDGTANPASVEIQKITPLQYTVRGIASNGDDLSSLTLNHTWHVFASVNKGNKTYVEAIPLALGANQTISMFHDKSAYGTPSTAGTVGYEDGDNVNFALYRPKSNVTDPAWAYYSYGSGSTTSSSNINTNAMNGASVDNKYTLFIDKESKTLTLREGPAASATVKTYTNDKKTAQQAPSTLVTPSTGKYYLLARMLVVSGIDSYYRYAVVDLQNSATMTVNNISEFVSTANGDAVRLTGKREFELGLVYAPNAGDSVTEILSKLPDVVYSKGADGNPTKTGSEEPKDGVKVYFDGDVVEGYLLENEANGELNISGSTQTPVAAELNLIKQPTVKLDCAVENADNSTALNDNKNNYYVLVTLQRDGVKAYALKPFDPAAATPVEITSYTYQTTVNGQTYNEETSYMPGDTVTASILKVSKTGAQPTNPFTLGDAKRYDAGQLLTTEKTDNGATTKKTHIVSSDMDKDTMILTAKLKESNITAQVHTAAVQLYGDNDQPLSTGDTTNINDTDKYYILATLTAKGTGPSGAVAGVAVLPDKAVLDPQNTNQPANYTKLTSDLRDKGFFSDQIPVNAFVPVSVGSDGKFTQIADATIGYDPDLYDINLRMYKANSILSDSTSTLAKANELLGANDAAPNTYEYLDPVVSDNGNNTTTTTIRLRKAFTKRYVLKIDATEAGLNIDANEKYFARVKVTSKSNPSQPHFAFIPLHNDGSTQIVLTGDSVDWYDHNAAVDSDFKFTGNEMKREVDIICVTANAVTLGNLVKPTGKDFNLITVGSSINMFTLDEIEIGKPVDDTNAHVTVSTDVLRFSQDHGDITKGYINDMLEQATDFGLYTIDLTEHSTDMESNIGAAFVHCDFGSNYGFSDNNIQVNRIKVTKVYLGEDGQPLANARVKLKLYKVTGLGENGVPSSLTFIKATPDDDTMNTNSDGIVEYVFDKLPAGTYLVKEEIAGYDGGNEYSYYENGEHQSIDATKSLFTKFEDGKLEVHNINVNVNYFGDIDNDVDMESILSNSRNGWIVVGNETDLKSLRKANGDENIASGRYGTVTLAGSEADSGYYYPKIDIQSDIINLRGLSRELGDSASSQSVRVINEKLDVFNNGDGYRINDDGRYVVVNVDVTGKGSHIKFNPDMYLGGTHLRAEFGKEGGEYASRVLFNFITRDKSGKAKPYTGIIDTTKEGAGILLAPAGIVADLGGNWGGTIICAEARHTGSEIHSDSANKIQKISTVVTNSLTAIKTGNLELKKVYSDSSKDNTTWFKFKVTLRNNNVDQNDTQDPKRTLFETKIAGKSFIASGLKSGNSVTFVDKSVGNDHKAEAEIEVRANGKMKLPDGTDVVIDNKVIITGLPEGTTYTVEEIPTAFTEQYEQDGAVEYTSDKAEPQTLQKIEAQETETATVTNKHKVGGLKVKKVLEGNNTDSNQDFNFTVTIYKDAERTTVDTSVTGKHGGMEFNEGVAGFTLKHNQEKVADKLPTGATFKVEETEANQDGYLTYVTLNGTILANDTATGTIVDGEAADIIYTNARTKIEVEKKWKINDEYATDDQLANLPDAIKTIDYKVYRQKHTATPFTDANKEGEPEDITSTLTERDGADAITAQLSADNSWKEEIKNLPYGEIKTTTTGGETTYSVSRYEYYVVETAKTGWYPEKTVKPDEDGKCTLTNELVNIHASKVWQKADGTELTGQAIPANLSVTFTLLANSVATAHTVTLNGSDATSGGTVTPANTDYEASWVAWFTYLPKCDAAGEITYTVQETTTQTGYTILGKDTVSDGGNIINRENSKGKITLTKVDAANSQIPVAGAEFKLYKVAGEAGDADDTEVASAYPSGATCLTTDEQGQIVVENLLPGTYYFVETKAPDNYQLPAQCRVPATGGYTVEDNKIDVAVQSFTENVTNTKKPVELIITKTIADAAAAAMIDANENLRNAIIFTVTSPNGFARSFTYNDMTVGDTTGKRTKKYTLADGLVYGGTYTVKETDVAGLTDQGYIETVTKTYQVNTTEATPDANGAVSVTLTSGADVPTSTGQVDVTNTYTPETIEIYAEKEWYNASQTKLTAEKAKELSLKVSVQLYKTTKINNGEGSEEAVGDAVELDGEADNLDGQTDVSGKEYDAWKTKWTGLRKKEYKWNASTNQYDVYTYTYCVKETVTQDGYSETTDLGSQTPTDVTTTFIIKNTEDAKYSLPETGGMGRGAVYAAGALLVLAAAMLLALEERKRVLRATQSPSNNQANGEGGGLPG